MSNVTVVPVFDQATHELQYQVLQFTTDLGFTDIVADNAVVATETVIEGEHTFFDITLNCATDLSVPKAMAPTPVNHTIKLTATQITSLELDAETKVRITVKLDDSPVTGVLDRHCWLDATCKCIKCDIESAGTQAP